MPPDAAGKTSLVLFYQYVEPPWTDKEHREALKRVIAIGNEHKIKSFILHHMLAHLEGIFAFQTLSCTADHHLHVELRRRRHFIVQTRPDNSTWPRSRSADDGLETGSKPFSGSVAH